MANILTPVSLWKNFNDNLEILPVTFGEKTEDGIKYEYVKFSGRDTGMGRVSVYGVFACSEAAPSQYGVLVLPDSCNTVDEGLLKFFVKNGYSALMVDYRGKWEGAERYTVYPENVAYANLARCGRRKDFVDESADKTCWYEWTAVGIYAGKYLSEKLGGTNVGVVGIRDGGEIAWKLAAASRFACAVPVSACGWKAYAGFDKFGTAEPQLDEERYRFLAGIDSQAYAPYVKCPILMLCPTNDKKSDYDRAYDTFSRINPEFANDSVIAYSVKSNACIGRSGVNDMFMFLNSFVKQRQVFIPKPAEISVLVDENENLIARTTFDDQGEVESFGLYMAEDCISFILRDWSKAPYKCKIGRNEHEFYLNVYDKTTILFTLCYVTYKNGFTVWSKIAVKKIGGQFRNGKPKHNVFYCSEFGTDGFSIADYEKYAVGGMFLPDDSVMPALVTAGKNLKGIYSACGLASYRMNSPQFMPESDCVLRLDICPEANMQLELKMINVDNGEVFSAVRNVVGGVWQTVVLESKQFKAANGASLSDFVQSLQFIINGKGKYAVNNVMWL